MAVRAPRPPAKRVANRAPVGHHYRQRWTWDKVAWGTHCVDCYPGSCMYHVFVKDGKVAFEEAAGNNPVVIEGIPDRNPMGCQKGAAWSRTLYGQERVLY